MRIPLKEEVLISQSVNIDDFIAGMWSLIFTKRFFF